MCTATRPPLLSRALAAFYQQIPVGHVEAGLRTWNIYSPFPEEMNRMLVGRLASLHFAPTARNRENLLRENALGEIYVTGNTVIDAMRHDRRRLPLRGPGAGSAAGHGRQICSADRAPTRKPGRAAYGDLPRRPAPNRSCPRTARRLPCAPEPRRARYGLSLLSGHARIHLTDPVNLRDAHNFMARCRFVMTDSAASRRRPRRSAYRRSSCGARRSAARG